MTVKDMWSTILETRVCPNCGRILDSYSGMPTDGVPSSVFRGSCPCGTEIRITEVFEDGDEPTEIFGEIVIL